MFLKGSVPDRVTRSICSIWGLMSAWAIPEDPLSIPLMFLGRKLSFLGFLHHRASQNCPNRAKSCLGAEHPMNSPLVSVHFVYFSSVCFVGSLKFDLSTLYQNYWKLKCATFWWTKTVKWQNLLAFLQLFSTKNTPKRSKSTSEFPINNLPRIGRNLGGSLFSYYREPPLVIVSSEIFNRVFLLRQEK